MYENILVLNYLDILPLGKKEIEAAVPNGRTDQ